MEIYRVAFIGHRVIHNIRYVEDSIEELALGLLSKHQFVEFNVGRNGDFDICAASAIKRAQRKFGTKNSSLNLVLPYKSNDESYFKEFYDEICYPLSKKAHYKSAIIKRNQWMIDNADMLVCYVEENRQGGALTSLKYAKKRSVDSINLANNRY